MDKIMTRSDGSIWRAKSFNEKTRSVEVVAATEATVNVYDWERGDVVPEVLLMSGLSLPKNKQVPLMDSHSRGSVSHVLGSARGFMVVGDHLEATVFFSDDQAGRSAAEKVRDGHLTDFSVGYRVERSEWIPNGETMTVNGRAFEGPLKVTTKWKLRELSVTPIGADEGAKTRSLNNHNKKDTMKMETQELNADQIRQEERERVQEITAMCTRFDCEHIGRQLVDNGASVDDARQSVMKYMEKTKIDPCVPLRNDNSRYDVGRSGEEKLMAAMSDGLLIRAGVPLKQVAAGAEDFRGAALVDIARECLNLGGNRAKGLGADRILKEALSARAHSTADFPALLGNVMGKGLRQLFMQAPSTFEAWTSEGSLRDFKEVSRVQLGEGPELLEVPELSEYRYGTFGESREVYKLNTYGRMFSISRQALVNDDLGAFFRVPKSFAMAAKRLINSSAYAVLTANAAMGDGVALFHEDHSNYVGSGSGAAPSIATLDAARTLMRRQTGIDGVALGIAPRLLIVPPESETEGDQLINTPSGFDVSEGVGTSNPFYKKLELVVDPSLSTGWYLASDPAMFDTVEIGYLNGEKFPTLETQKGWQVDGIEYKVFIDFGVKALDHRGLFFNYGA